MPLIIVIILVVIYSLIFGVEKAKPKKRIYGKTSDMLDEMVGKSQAERREILRKYQNPNNFKK